MVVFVGFSLTLEAIISIVANVLALLKLREVRWLQNQESTPLQILFYMFNCRYKGSPGGFEQ